MGLKKYKPRTASLRFTTLSDFEGVSKKRPERRLVQIKKSTAGRNSQGRITIRHRGGGHKKFLRLIDFKRQKFDIPAKVQAIEYIDKNIVGVVRREMDASGEPYRLLLMPDHPTPVAVRTHTSDPIPYMIYDSTRAVACASEYTEEAAAKTGYVYPEGYRLMEHFTEKP